jgi:hypothetical protein
VDLFITPDVHFIYLKFVDCSYKLHSKVNVIFLHPVLRLKCFRQCRTKTEEKD